VTPMRRILMLVLVSAWLATPLQAAAEPDLEAKFREAGDQLTCQCSCREQITVCKMQNCGSATPMRAEVRSELAAGKSVDEIVAGFVQRVGKQVLSAPTMKGFDLAAWVAPFALLVLGLVVVSWIVVKMARPRATVAAAPQGTAGPFDARMEAELRDFEEES